MLDVKSFYSSAYNYATREEKLLLKLWKYSVETGIISEVDFNEYKKTFLITETTSMVKGYCIDMSDIGNVEECIEILVALNKRRTSIV